MSEPKTKITNQNPNEFLKTVEPVEKRQDAFTLLKIFEDITREEAVMWGSSIVGFGKYHYKSERSRQEGDWFWVGFSPRKQNITLYIMHGNKNNPDLEKLGKHKESMGCLYINKLSDVDQVVLERLIKKSLNFMKNVSYKDLVDSHQSSSSSNEKH